MEEFGEIEKFINSAIGFIFIPLIIIEIIVASVQHVRLHHPVDSIVSAGMGILGVVTRLALKLTTLQIYFWLYQFRLFDIGTGIWAWVLIFFANEFVYYWFHRWSHEYRFLWATHVNHHSSEYMNFFTAARTPFMNAIHHIIFWMPLPLLGMHPGIVLIIETIGFLFAFIQHTEIIPKLGAIEWVVNTPSHHRVHHGSNPQYIDKNYGNTLIIFDRMFGTFEPEQEKVKYGITKNVGSYNPLRVIFHEWISIFKDAANARSRRERWKFIFGRVGWKPEEGKDEHSPPANK